MPTSTDRRRTDTKPRTVHQDVDGLVDAAVRVFVERGYDGSSMEDVARAAGLAKSSIYHHVSGKEELLERAIDRALAESAAAIAAIDDQTEDPLERLTLCARYVIEKAVEDSPTQALLRRLPWMSASVPWAMERYLAYEQVVSGYVRRAVDAGVVRADIEPMLMNRLLWLMTCAVADVRRIDPDVSVEALVAAGMGILTDGIGPRR